MVPRVVVWDPALDELTVAEPVMEAPLGRPVVSTSTSRVAEVPAARVPIEQVSLPDPAFEQLVPEAAMPARSKVGVPWPSVTLTLAESPVTETVEVLAMVAPHPPSVPALTWFWRGGVVGGTWKVGVAGLGRPWSSRGPPPRREAYRRWTPRSGSLDHEGDLGVDVPGGEVDLPGPRSGLEGHRVVGGVVGVGGVGHQGVAQRQVGGRGRLDVGVDRPAQRSPDRGATVEGGGLGGDGEGGGPLAR